MAEVLLFLMRSHRPSIALLLAGVRRVVTTIGIVLQVCGGVACSVDPSSAPANPPNAPDVADVRAVRRTRIGSEQPMEAAMRSARFGFYLASDGELHAGTDTWYARTDRGGFSISLDPMTHARPEGDVRFETIDFGRAHWSARLASSFATSRGVVSRRADGVEETIEGRPEGIEQTWRLDKRPPGDGDLTVRVLPVGATYARTDDAGIQLVSADGRKVRYGHASWVDAHGAATAVRAEWFDHHIELRVPRSVLEATAYPAVLDPLIGPELATDAPVEGPSANINGSRAAVGACVGSTCMVGWGGSSLRRFDQDLVPLDPYPVDGPANRIVSMSGTTSSFVVLRGSNSSPYTYTVERYDTAGAAVGAPMTISTTATSSRAGVGCAGTQCLVVWMESSGSRAMRIASDGTVLDPMGFPLAASSPTAVACNDVECLVGVGSSARIVSANGLVSPTTISTSSTVNAIATNGADFALVFGATLRILHPNGAFGSNTTLPASPRDVTWSGTRWVSVYGDATGNVTSVATLPNGQPGGQNDVGVIGRLASVVPRPGGGVVTVGVDDDGSATTTEYDVTGRLLDVSGAPYGADVVVNNSDNPQLNPVLVAGAGEYLLAWTDRRLGEWGVYVQRRDALGQAVDPIPALVASPVADWAVVSVASSPSGYLLAAYDGSGSVPPKLVRLSPQALVLDNPPMPITPYPLQRMAVGFDGVDYVVAYSESGIPAQLRARRVTQSGTVLDPSPLTLGSISGTTRVATSPSSAGAEFVWVQSGQTVRRTVSSTGVLSTTTTLYPDSDSDIACFGGSCLIADPRYDFASIPGSAAVVVGATPPGVHRDWGIGANASEFLLFSSMSALAGPPGSHLRRFSNTDPPVELGTYVDVTGTVLGTRVASLSPDSSLLCYSRTVPAEHAARVFVRFVDQDAGAPLGDVCSADAECASNHCADSVCCNEACDGAALDCRACSVAMGAPTDGQCATLGPTTVCRPASGECDVAETCSGMAPTCGPDVLALDGDQCSGGVCMSGTCIATGTNSSTSAASTAATTGSAVTVTASGTSSTSVGSVSSGGESSGEGTGPATQTGTGGDGVGGAPSAPDPSGCSCDIAGADDVPGGLALAAACLVVAGVRRRTSVRRHCGFPSELAPECLCNANLGGQSISEARMAYTARRTHRTSMLAALVLACLNYACGSDDQGSGGASASSSKASAAAGPTCEFFITKSCQLDGECAQCLHDSCCKEVIECKVDPTCATCFAKSNFTPCAGRETANDLVVCSAVECPVCNGCY